MSNPSYYKSVKSKIGADDFVTDFNRRVYGEISARLDKDMPVDLSFIAPDFSDDEVSVITRIVSSSRLISNTFSEIEDCVKVLKGESGKNKYDSASGMSDSDFLNLFNKK